MRKDYLSIELWFVLLATMPFALSCASGNLPGLEESPTSAATSDSPASQPPSTIDAQPFGGGELAWARAKIIQDNLISSFEKIEAGKDLTSLCGKCVSTRNTACIQVGKLTDLQRTTARDFLLSVKEDMAALVRKDVRKTLKFSPYAFTVDGQYASARTTIDDQGLVELYENDWVGMPIEDNESLLVHEFGHKVIFPAIGGHLDDAREFGGFFSGRDLLTAAGYCLVAYRFEHPGYSDVILAEPRLIGYWRLDETEGDVAHDISGYENHGKYGAAINRGKVGALTYDHNQSIETTGTGSVAITVPNLETAPGSWVTVEMWMKWSGHASQQFPILFAGYGLWFYQGRLGINTSNSSQWGFASSGLVNKWVHLVWVAASGSAYSGKIYVNGNQQSLADNYSPLVANKATTKNVTIGYIRGLVDEVAIYDEALTLSKIRDHYYAGTH